MPAASASAVRSVPSYQAPPVGRATDGMTATVGILPHRRPDLGDERGHDRAAPVEEGGELAVGPRIGEPERVGHVVRESRCRWRDRPRRRRATRARSAVGVDARLLRARAAMLAEAEAELIVEPAVRLHQRELVVVAVGVGREARRLDRDAHDRIALGHVAAEADRELARRGIGRAERSRHSGRRRRWRPSPPDTLVRAGCCGGAPSTH